MSVATVKAQLALLQASITGITSAFAQAPISLPENGFPCFVNLARAASIDSTPLGHADRVVEGREYLMRLYVAPLLEGTDAEAEGKCEPFFPLVRDFFLARPSLGGLTYVQRAWPLGDSGVVPLRYAMNSYIGIEFRLQVWEYVDISYAATE
jgi:hypothetical protein